MPLHRMFLIPALLLISLSSQSIFAQNDSAESSRVIFIGLPDSAVVHADGKVVEHDIGGWYQVPSGDVKIEISQSDSVVFSSNMNFKAGEDSRIIIECRMGCAHFELTSKPSGAKLSIDGENYGYTPFKSYYFRPGNSREIKLSMPGYAPLKESISISPEKSLVLELQMDRSQEWKDSVKTVVLKKKQGRQRVQKIVFGVLTMAFTGAGVFYDDYAKSQLKAADVEAAAYDASVTTDGCVNHRSAYNQNISNARKAINFRNTFLGVAGGCLVGVGLSFVF